MRYTYGTIAAVTSAVLVLAAFWPGPEAPLTPQGIAQTKAAGNSAPGLKPDAPAEGQVTALQAVPFQGNKERIEAELAKPLPAVDYSQLAFRNMIFDLSKITELTIMIDPALIESAEIDPETMIDLKFPENAVSAKTLLKLAFKSMGLDGVVAYTIRDNIVLITDIQETTEVVIYNCRDLIEPFGPKAPGLAGTESDSGAEFFVQAGGMGMGGMGMGGFGGDAPGAMPGMGGGLFPQTPEQQLIQVITGTIQPASWSAMGGPGSIQSINGLIVINHTREVHEQVKHLLQLLREAMKEGGKEQLEIRN